MYQHPDAQWSALWDLPGWSDLDNDFCNRPVDVTTTWPLGSDPAAVIRLCGRLRGHQGDCDPVPPMSDLVGDPVD